MKSVKRDRRQEPPQRFNGRSSKAFALNAPVPSVPARIRRSNGRAESRALGILFLHHSHNPVTRFNLAQIRLRNPDATIATMSPGDPLPGGYTLRDTPPLKRLHAQLPARRVDLLVCSWFLQKREACRKWWIAEWDVYPEVSVADYYGSVWEYPFVASSVRLPRREPEWNWFRSLQGTPKGYRPFLVGAVPFIFLFDELALAAACNMLLKHPFFSGNSEMRLATAANRAGYPPCGFSPPHDGISWMEWKRVTGPPGIFHPVKHIADYRQSLTIKSKNEFEESPAAF